MNINSSNQPPLSLAEIKSEASARDFSELFRNQYVLDPNPNTWFPGWSQRSLNGWTLHHGFALRVLDILDNEKSHIGFLLGHALHSDSRLVRDFLMVPAKADAKGFEQALESQVSVLSGRYLAIVLSPQHKLILTDPVSDIPAIYDRETGRVASSLGLVLTRPIQNDLDFSIRKVLTGGQTLSFGHTLDRNIKRCIPNHMLDLTTFKSRRFWPTQNTKLIGAAEETDQALDAIADRLSAHMARWIVEFKCILPVTGGRDSRTLLACASGSLNEIHQFMAHRFNNNTRRDAKTGNEIVSELGFPFVQYFLRGASVRQRSDMRLKMGWTGTRGELRALHAIERYPKDHIVLRGNILELLRANQYRNNRLNDKRVHLFHAIRRTGVEWKIRPKDADKWYERYLRWHDGLPPDAQKRAYDFGFIELLLPNTQSSYYTAMHRNPFINPFNDRRLLELAISIPPSKRYGQNLNVDIIKRKAPELLKHPFN